MQDQVFLLIQQEDEKDFVVSTGLDQLQEHYDIAQISLHAMLGQNNQTFKLKGKIHNQDLTISVDGGQHTQDFIQEQVVKFLGLTTSSSSQ